MSAVNGSSARPRSRSSRKDVHDARRTLTSRPSSQLLVPSGIVAHSFVRIRHQVYVIVDRLMIPSSPEASSRKRRARSKSASHNIRRERSPNASSSMAQGKSRASNISRPQAGPSAGSSSRSTRLSLEQDDSEQFQLVSAPAASSSKCECIVGYDLFFTDSESASLRTPESPPPSFYEAITSPSRSSRSRHSRSPSIQSATSSESEGSSLEFIHPHEAELSPWELDLKAGISLEDRVKREWERRNAAAIPTPVLSPDVVVKSSSEPAETQWTYPPRANSMEPNSISSLSSPVDGWEIVDEMANPSAPEVFRSKGKGKEKEKGLVPQLAGHGETNILPAGPTTWSNSPRESDLNPLSAEVPSARTAPPSLLGRPLPPIPMQGPRPKKRAPPPPPPLKLRQTRGSSQDNFLDLDPDPVDDPRSSHPGPSPDLSHPDRQPNVLNDRLAKNPSATPDIPVSVSTDVAQKRRRPLPEPPSAQHQAVVSAFDTLQVTNTAATLSTNHDTVGTSQSITPASVLEAQVFVDAQTSPEPPRSLSVFTEPSEYTDLDALVSQLDQGPPGSHYDVSTAVAIDLRYS
ncbi:hypothetical protein SISNIDRAFT_308658 [Sistotremastrum niveocremeum HHB9708]|uniref:Uncharacterized protein n=1 Tax=Sistotremastrum niveocremeum HHB9708 TaxID=1314777 RepID=A0A164XTA1_9AGAM|nr:hypothetical protein SISNIDRAFT_308658 [Sistotremastrum niveocremeum HHB9708]